MRTRIPLRMGGFLLLSLVWLLASAAPALAAGNQPEQAGRKIVVFQDRLVNEAAQEELLARTGAVKLKQLPLVNAAVVLAGPASERALRAQGNVLRIDDDIIVTTQQGKGKPPKDPPPPEPTELLPWGVARIDANQVWDTDGNKLVDPGANAGGGIRIAVLDTGIQLNHPDLQANIAGGVNIINRRKTAEDDNGHGTHVAGTIAAVNNTIGVVGVAPQARLYAVKVLDKNGNGYLSDIIDGLYWCITNNMQVVNMSLGASTHVQSFHDAVKAAYQQGIVLVAAAGNSGPGSNTVQYPGRYPEVVAVSATDESNTITSWSSRGPEVELAAPGLNIYSTYRGGGYTAISGTSMACPHVTGTVALVIATGRVADGNGDGLLHDEVRALLRGAAADLGTAGLDPLYGYGLVKALAAVSAP